MLSFEFDNSQTLIDKPRNGGCDTDLAGLISHLVGELQKNWALGSVLRVETLLSAHPKLNNHPEAIVRLIYEEVFQRRKIGEVVTLGQLYNRFPQWHEELKGLLGVDSTLDVFPAEGEAEGVFGQFEIVSELGRGSGGRVYLARQLDLANRPVVLKVIPSGVKEHLSLARLQHTNIVPLYGIYDNARDRRRALCMPYFGCTTLQHVFEMMQTIPMPARHGRDFVTVLERREFALAAAPVEMTPARMELASLSYLRVVCGIALHLAEALHYAHQRGLVHLDLKPSNVLMGTDGQPMLLDFHLARAPLAQGDDPPTVFGGTPPYMPAEQKIACDDVTNQRRLTCAVDARADLYALGMLLFVAFTNDVPSSPETIALELRRLNPDISVGLSDIVSKCLASEPENRYPNADLLARDLRAHLDDKPLVGVANRSTSERWRKWRRRRPSALALVLSFSFLLATCITLITFAVYYNGKRQQTAEAFFFAGRSHFQEGRYPQAVESLMRAQEVTQSFFGNEPLRRAIQKNLEQAVRSGIERQLNDFVAELRGMTLADNLDLRALVVLEVGCQSLWDKRHVLLENGGKTETVRLELEVRQDLSELAFEWAHIHLKLAPPAKINEYRSFAENLLQQEASFCPSPSVLAWHQASLFNPTAALKALPPTETPTAWELYCLGRVQLERGERAKALTTLEASIHQEPTNFAANFCLGICAASQDRNDIAVNAFSVCIGRRPEKPQAYVARGNAYAALGQDTQALRDFQRAFLLRPNVTEVLLARGQVLLRLNRFDEALGDFTQAKDQGADPALVDPIMECLQALNPSLLGPPLDSRGQP